MQLIGASRRSLVTIMTIESLIVAAAVAGTAATVAAFTIGPVLVEAEVSIGFPLGLAAGFGATVTALVATAMVGPTLWSTAGPAVRAAGTST
jgi:hypothetical protein